MGTKLGFQDEMRTEDARYDEDGGIAGLLVIEGHHDALGFFCVLISWMFGWDRINPAYHLISSN